MFLTKYLKPLFLLGGVFIFSLLIKIKDIKNLLNNGDNVLTCFDCFLYGRLSKELYSNIYSSIDYLRNVPDFVVNWNPPPLVSLLPVILAKLTHIKLEMFFVFLPPILSILFIIPLYFWLRNFAPIHVFLGGAILGIFNLIYFNRTMPGRLDTDSLILFFVFLTIIFLTKAVYDNKRSYIWIIIASLSYHLFMWWYSKPIFSFFFLLSLILGLLYVKASKKELIFKSILFILLTSPLYMITALLEQIKGYTKIYILKENLQIIPYSLGSYITELKPVDFDSLVMFTTDNTLSLIVSFIGLFIFLYFYRKYTVLILPILIIGLTSFFAGNRFIIYLAPFLGIGLGYMIYLIFSYAWYRFKAYKKILYLISIVIVILYSFPAQRLYASVSPIIKPDVWNSLKEVKNKLEENSYVWSWWDYGNIVSYTTRAGTFTSNADFNPIKIYFFAHSMMIYDEDKTRNLIAFVTNNYYRDYGKNIKSLKDTLELTHKAYTYSKPLTKPVYIVLFPGIISKRVIHNLGVFGTNIHDSNVPSVSVFTNCEDKIEYYDCGIFKIQKGTEKIEWSRYSIKKNPPYKEVIYVRRTGLIRYKRVIYKNPKYKYDRILEIIESSNGMYILIGNEKIKPSILNRMFVFADNFKNFKLIYDNFPYLVVYKVAQ